MQSLRQYGSHQKPSPASTTTPQSRAPARKNQTHHFSTSTPTQAETWWGDGKSQMDSVFSLIPTTKGAGVGSAVESP